MRLFLRRLRVQQTIHERIRHQAFRRLPAPPPQLRDQPACPTFGPGPTPGPLLCRRLQHGQLPPPGFPTLHDGQAAVVFDRAGQLLRQRVQAGQIHRHVGGEDGRRLSLLRLPEAALVGRFVVAEEILQEFVWWGRCG